jgi:hypothetical protein
MIFNNKAVSATTPTSVEAAKTTCQILPTVCRLDNIFASAEYALFASAERLFSISGTTLIDKPPGIF